MTANRRSLQLLVLIVFTILGAQLVEARQKLKQSAKFLRGAAREYNEYRVNKEAKRQRTSLEPIIERQLRDKPGKGVLVTTEIDRYEDGSKSLRGVSLQGTGDTPLGAMKESVEKASYRSQVTKGALPDDESSKADWYTIRDGELKRTEIPTSPSNLEKLAREEIQREAEERNRREAKARAEAEAKARAEAEAKARAEKTRRDQEQHDRSLHDFFDRWDRDPGLIDHDFERADRISRTG